MMTAIADDKKLGRKKCEMVLPKKTACDVLDQTRINKKNYVCKRLDIPYASTVGSEQYIIGRNRILEESGFKKLASKCDNIKVLNLPWRDYKGNIDEPVKGVPYWSPIINNMFINCAANMAKNDYPVRMLLWIADVKYLKNKKALDDKLPQYALFMYNKETQFVVEACQMMFQFKDYKLYVESKPSNKLYYTAFLTKGAPPNGTFKDMTKVFKETLKERLDTLYRPSFYGVNDNRYTPSKERRLDGLTKKKFKSFHRNPYNN